jgi:hypothetical protein
LQRTALSLGAAVLLAVASSTALEACSSPSTCSPPALHLSTTRVAPGATTTLSSPASSCPLPGILDATYVVTLLTLGRSAPAELARVRPRADGSFSVLVRMPVAAAPGDAVLSVSGSVDDAACHGSNRKCAEYGIALSLVAS